ncbi:MAG: mycofactocin biosynthesis peptidyl-dipeptidase MftE [Microthrixaceae bacterium]
MGSRLSDLTWPALAEGQAPGDGQLLVVPVGSCEQHGPHLPFDTDTRIALALAERLAERFERIIVAPALGITASGEHQSFPGTLSIGTTAFEHVVVELARSALPPPELDLPSPFEAVLFVNGHGGNVVPFTHAEALLRSESRDVRVWHPQVPGGDSHAGFTETSILLHIDPDCVRKDCMVVGSTRRWREIATSVVEAGLASVAPNGILGDPSDANAIDGEEIFETLSGGLVERALEWFPLLGEP